ncbi:MAG: hypothetical protein RLZZ399_1172 [Verrucomicrobiota bacterium]|jgi:uncharacterized protein (UPF0261 family)
MATIAVIGTLDTKGREHQFVADFISQSGHQAHLIDVGTGGEPQVIPYMSREAVAQMGGMDPGLFEQGREAAEAAMSQAASKVLLSLMEQKKIHGIISLGGGGGTAIATAAMRALPLGFPKVMVSTLAGGNTSKFLGSKDIVMIPCIVDLEGLNRITRPILAGAAGAICGMVDAASLIEGEEQRPLVVVSVNPHTIKGAECAKHALEKAGYEVALFGATGPGSVAMESLILGGHAVGVLELTTAEWAEAVLGEGGSKPLTRLEAVAKAGIPAVLVPGGVDSVTFRTPPAIPAKYAGRKLHELDAHQVALRTSTAECAEIGRRLAEKASLLAAGASVLLPTEGVSNLGAPGGPLCDPEADQALFVALKNHLSSHIAVRQVPGNINHPGFAEACVGALLQRIPAKA